MILFQRETARTVLSDEKVLVEKSKIFYCEPLHHIETMMENVVLESFGEAYESCRDDF